MDKIDLQEKQQKIQDLIEQFCNKNLDKEYLFLSTKLIQKLGRKRTAPLSTGKPEIWAAAIIHALGTINFLFDKSFEPYVTIDEINNFFGTSKSTTGSKSKQIREMLNLNVWDKDFSTMYIRNNNPFANLGMLDGFIVPLD